jgi:F-type H+-transporting ATPase subunit b
MNLIFIAAAATDGGILKSLGETAKETGLQFGVSWWLFLSQCISFGIVAILLNKFAYKPILNVLEERRERIQEGLANAEKIKGQLAESQQRYQEILTKANAEAQKMIEEARQSATALADKRSQQAIAEAEQILAKAREASKVEHDRVLTELKREVGRLVIETTTKVTGKILTPQDRERIAEETIQQVA